MGENVQCPVCTLFLHAGMNLSDHLETHPKEQVIKALVQMTITKGGGPASITLAASLAGDTKPEVDSKLPMEKETDLNTSATSNSSSSSSSGSTASNNSLNFSTAFNSISTLVTASAKKQQNMKDAIPPANSGVDTGATGEIRKGVYNALAGNVPQAYQRSCVASPAGSAFNETETMTPTDFSVFGTHRYQSQSQQQNVCASQLQQQQPQTPAHPAIQTAVNPQKRIVLPVPPPPPLPSQQFGQVTGTLQHTLLASPAAQRHQNIHPHQHQQQNLKILYSTALPPPPPPLQLFFQQPPQAQHQKPPPAYGTAISQIRSQHNLNKKPVTMTILQHQPQQMQQQQIRETVPSQLYPPHHVQSLSSQSPIATSTTTKDMFPANKSSELPPTSVAAQQKYISDVSVQAHQTQYIGNASITTANHKTVMTPQHTAVTEAPQPPSSPASHPMKGVTATPTQGSAVASTSISSSNTRQTNSPFRALLVAAAQSPSSVLRYAESPVAHYLERENGDFIVQETPKHIVECVEKDNGEFSVIERIYQSPPSVLHIHDDDENGDEKELTTSDSGGEPKNLTNKTTSNNEKEEFMIIESESEQEEFLATATPTSMAAPVATKRSRTDTNENRGNVHVSGNSSMNVSASECGASSENVSAIIPGSDSNSSSNFNSSSCSNSLCTPRKKSSKNTITVLSDVQLNLNEYLDLVGNIIASSKISPQRTTLAGAMPIPMLKVEKIEPPDEYESQHQRGPQNDDEHEQKQPQQPQIEYEKDEKQDEEKYFTITSVEPTVIEPPTIANKNETEELVEKNCSSNKISINENDNNLTSEDCKEYNHSVHSGQSVGATIIASSATCPSHATSVIRMATTSQQQHSKYLNEHESLQGKVNSTKPDTFSATMMTDCSESISIKPVNDKGEDCAVEDLSKTELKVEPRQQERHCPVGGKNSSPTDILVPPQPPSYKKGPKKLIIKPKVTKTESIANSNASSKVINGNAHNNQKHNLVLDTKTANICSERPTTSAMAQKELQEKERQQKLQQEEQQSQQHSQDQQIQRKLKQKQEKEEKIYETLPQNVVIKSEPNSIPYDSCSNSSSNCILSQHLKSSAGSNGIQPVELKREQPCSLEQVSSVAKDEKQLPLKVEKESSSNENVTEDARVLLDFANSKKHCSATGLPANFLSSSSIFSSAATSTAAVTAETPRNHTLNDRPLSLTSLRCEDEFIAAEVQEIVISSPYSSQSASDIALNATSSAPNTAPSVAPSGQHQHQQQQTFGYPFSFLYGVGGNNAACSHLDAKSHFSPIYQQAQDATTAATLASGSNSAQIEDSTSTHQSGNNFGGSVTHWYHHAVPTGNSDFEAALAIDCNAAVDGDVGKYLDLDACKRENLLGVQAAPSSTSSSFTAATDSSLAGGCTTDVLNIRTDEKMPAKGEISGQESNCDIDNSWSQPMYGEISTRFFKTSFPGIFQQENGWNNDEYFTVQDLSASTTATASASTNKPTKSFDFRFPLEASTSATALGNNSSNNLQLFTQHSGDVLPSTSANKKRRKRDLHSDKMTITRMQPTATITSQQILFNHHQNQHQRPLLEHLQLHQLNPTTSSSALLAGPSTADAGSSVGTVTQQKPRKKIYQCTHCTAQFPKLKDRNSHMIVEHNYVRQNRRLICSQTNQSTLTATITSGEAVNVPSSNGGALLQTHSVDFVEDSKQGIVKIEIDNCENQLAITTVSVSSGPKTELIDEKDSLALVPTTGADADVAARELDTKPALQALSVSTPATKLATLYRMLVSYNISTLKQSQNLSELEEKLIETSIFFCYVCRRNFGSVKLYDAHLTEHPAECFTCGKKFHRWKNFSLHLKRHLGWKEFGCNVCDKKFVVRSALVEHMRMHTGHTPLKCKVCGKYFKRYSNLTQHRKRHGKQIVRKKEYVCHCGEVLPSKARFLWHKETHDAKPKCCPYCCDRFVHANSLRRHIRLAHSDKFDYTEPMECPMCKQIFAKSSIKAHMATHSMDTQHDCPICNKSFSTKWNLKIHSWVHANRTAKPFKCEHCPKAFVREVDFKNHMNAHKQIKPYTCEYCGCKFIRKYNYMRHRREHHGNKKFTCDLCKKSFHRHYYLIEHRRIHTGERPFQCTICGKSSTTKTNHNKHLKIHHSRDPFTVEA